MAHTHPKNTQVLPPPVKPIPQEAINEFVIQKLNPLLVRLIAAFLLCFPESDVNVF